MARVIIGDFRQIIWILLLCAHQQPEEKLTFEGAKYIKTGAIGMVP